MLIMAVKFLCIRNDKRKINATNIIFGDKNIKVTNEMQLAKLQTMGIDAIKIIDSKPKAFVME